MTSPSRTPRPISKKETDRHLAGRRARAEGFIAEPHRFKVCDLCNSISPVSAGLCRVCGGYCWHTDRKTVIRIARIIRKTPFPLTSGVVPRGDY